MRVAVNGRFLAAPVTGVQRFAHEVLRRLVRQADVTLLLPDGIQVPAGLECRAVRGRRRGHAWERLELPGATAAWGADVVLHPANSAVRTPAPYVMVLHDVLPLTHPSCFTRRYALWTRMTAPPAARGAARVVTVSEWSRRAICGALGVAPERVMVAPQGLDPFAVPASQQAVDQVRAHFGLPPRFVLSVGAEGRKDTSFLVRMVERWEQLHGAAPTLVVVGAASSRVHAADSGTGGLPAAAFRALGRVSDQELHALYTGAMALCSASRAEGLGRPPLEAIACGTPAVVAPYGPAADVLGDLASARVVPLAPDRWISAIHALQAVPTEARAADAAALRLRWSWAGAADVVLDACRAARDEGRRTVRPVVGAMAVHTPRGRRSAPPTHASAWGAPPSAAIGRRVALVHDWLTGTRGGERVLEELANLFPAAHLYTLLHVPGSAPPAVEALPIHTSFVDALPGIRHYYRYCLPLFPAAIERLDLSGYDLVVSSSHCVAKAVRVPDGHHLCYCHTPMRYVWDQTGPYLGAGALGTLQRMLLTPAVRRMRRWDAATAGHVDTFVANSAHVQGRIRAYYGRAAQVVHPPVEVGRFRPALEREDVYVCAGALVPYKRTDLAVAAFNHSGRRLLVVGDGPRYRALRRAARPNVVFTGRVSDGEMAAILGRARGVIMPMVEDFGIAAVEAQAAGAPVLAYGAGGALETVVDGITGLHFHQQTPAAIEEAVRRAERLEFDPGALRANAERFGPAAFRAGMLGVLASVAEPRTAAGGVVACM